MNKTDRDQCSPGAYSLGSRSGQYKRDIINSK